MHWCHHQTLVSSSRTSGGIFNHFKHLLESFRHMTENHVFTIQMRSTFAGNEELTSVGSW